MKVFKQIPAIRTERWRRPETSWGLVPTMGYLHEGHASLLRRARQENDCVAASIFVNPKQFNNAEDLTNYPRDLDRDLALLEREGADLVWTPEPQHVYPGDFDTNVEVAELAKPLEGEKRPGHFRGVTTVVAKLFNVFQPDRAYFGEKDLQQLLVIRRMAEDLNFNTKIMACATVREADGLAMSSRNARLSTAARQEAACLFQALQAARAVFADGERDASRLRDTMRRVISTHARTKIDYLSVADLNTLQELDEVKDVAAFLLAVFIDEIRLIDNMVVRTSERR